MKASGRRRAWADFADRIGLPEVTFHALRASQLIDQGVDIVTISKRLGHAKPDITLRIYAHQMTATTTTIGTPTT